MLLVGLAAPAGADTDTSLVSEEDWLRLSVTGEVSTSLYDLVDSLHGQQTPEELALLEKVPSYSIIYEDGSVAGLPFPDGTSLPELIADGSVNEHGEPSTALAQQLGLSVENSAPTLDSDFVPATTGPHSCIGATSHAARTYRYVASGKSTCDAWEGTGFKVGLSIDPVFQWNTGNAYYGCIAYRSASLHRAMYRAPGLVASLNPAAIVYNIGKATSQISRCAP